jgi:hypothetical protein
MQQQTTGASVKASDYLGYMYNTLHNPQKVWKLNDATGKFEELTAFTKLMEGTTNEYIWRLGEHNGKLYVATMDAGIGYGYMTQLTNGSFFKMSKEERISKTKYLTNVIKLLALAKGNEKADELRTKLEQLKELLGQYVETDQADDESIELIIDIQGLTQEIRTLITSYLQEQTSQHTAALAAILAQALENAQTISIEKLQAILALLTQLDFGNIVEKWIQFRELMISNPEEAHAVFTEQVKQMLMDDIAARGIGSERYNGRQKYYSENKSLAQLRGCSEQQRKMLGELRLTPDKRKAATVEINDDFDSFPD